MTPRQFIVLFVCVAIFALGQFHRASGSVFTPILMDRLALSAATGAGLVSAMFFATIAVQVPFGSILDQKGPRKVLAACMIIVAAGTALFAVASAYGPVLLSRILIGIGLASMGAATHVIVARNFSAKDFGYVSGLVVTLGGIGGLLGTYPLAVALARLTWAHVFGAVSVFTLLLALGIWKAVHPGAPSDAVPTPEGPSDGYLTLLQDRSFRPVLILGLVTFAPITTITGLWGGPFLQDALGFGPDMAGFVLLAFFVASILGAYVFGFLDRKLRARRRLILWGATLSVVSLILLAVLGPETVWVSIALLLTMIFCQQFYIPLGAEMRHAVSEHLLGRAAALHSLLAVAAIPLMQIGFGFLLDFAAGWRLDLADQYRLAFAGMAITILVCLVGYLWAHRSASE